MTRNDRIGGGQDLGETPPGFDDFRYFIHIGPIIRSSYQPLAVEYGIGGYADQAMFVIERKHA